MNKEVVELFAHTPRKVFIDCTVGMGGHAYHLLKHFDGSRVIGIDCDRESLKLAEENLKDYKKRIDFFDMNYTDLFEKLDIPEMGVSGILIDPGISTYQLQDVSRGFSHQSDARLDMRKDRTLPVSAHDVINHFRENQLGDIFHRFGEVRQAQALAKRIIEKRLRTPIETTSQLRDLVGKFFHWKPRKGLIHPAARVFQALRIFVNKELEGVEGFLRDIPRFLSAGARVIFLSYHSIEDRLAKQVFQMLKKTGQVKVISPFPALPSKEEIRENFASRSAKLRCVEIS